MYERVCVSESVGIDTVLIGSPLLMLWRKGEIRGERCDGFILGVERVEKRRGEEK